MKTKTTTQNKVIKKLSLACEKMFLLNKFAKSPECPPTKKEKIYELKKNLLKALYRLNLVTKVEKHIVQPVFEGCDFCGGDGLDPDYYDDCRKCDGDGEIMTFSGKEFYVFKIKTPNKTYSFHLPAEQVDFAPKIDKEIEVEPQETLNGFEGFEPHPQPRKVKNGISYLKKFLEVIH